MQEKLRAEATTAMSGDTKNTQEETGGASPRGVTGKKQGELGSGVLINN